MTHDTDNFAAFEGNDSQDIANEETMDNAAQNNGDNDPLAQAQHEIADLKDKYLRALAEMQNIQRRAKRDVEDANKYGVASAAQPFLTVADDLGRALDNIPADLPESLRSLLDGLRGIERNMQQALSKMGVVAIQAEAGQPLDPHEHEVMFEVETADAAHGTIMHVLETGYKIHDRLLRPTRVSVAKNSNTGSNNDAAVNVSA